MDSAAQGVCAMNTGVTIFTGVIIAAASSWITLQLALRRFRFERWWDLKQKAYQNVIEALYKMALCSERELDRVVGTKDISDEEDKLLSQDWKEASSEIRRARDVGSLLLSEDALRRLEKYEHDCRIERKAETSYFEELEAYCCAVNTCFADLKRIAKQDLGVK